MLTFEDAVRITSAAVPRTPADRLAGNALGQPDKLAAMLRNLADQVRTLAPEDAAKRCRLAARNLNATVARIDAGDDAVVASMTADGVTAIDIAMAADACTYCAMELERAQ